jgi:hypothetical protein
MAPKIFKTNGSGLFKRNGPGTFKADDSELKKKNGQSLKVNVYTPQRTGKAAVDVSQFGTNKRTTYKK